MQTSKCEGTRWKKCLRHVGSNCPVKGKCVRALSVNGSLGSYTRVFPVVCLWVYSRQKQWQHYFMKPYNSQTLCRKWGFVRHIVLSHFMHKNNSRKLFLFDTSNGLHYRLLKYKVYIFISWTYLGRYTNFPMLFGGHIIQKMNGENLVN